MKVILLYSITEQQQAIAFKQKTFGLYYLKRSAKYKS